MDAYQLVLESWRAKLAESARRPDNFTFASPPEFQALRKFRAKGEHGLLAGLYEAIGTADLLLSRTQPDLLPLTLLNSLGFLVLGAHWYRAAGEGERSALAGERALLELRAVLQAMERGTLELPAPYLRCYVVEMAGDAAVCFDRSTAAGLYREAAAGFKDVGRFDQMSDVQDPFPGEYLRALAAPVMPGGYPDAHLDIGAERIAYKLRHWVGE